MISNEVGVCVLRYNDCHLSNLNGMSFPDQKGLRYGITWNTWMGKDYGLNAAEMAISPMSRMGKR